MSVHMIYYKDGVKMMRPILNREEYLSQRDGGEQQSLLKGVREGKEQLKSKLVQMNYSCLPNEDGTLKGSKRMSSSIGMDIDHIGQGEMEELCSRILGKKDELGLLMLEKSARGQGYHLAFRRKQELSQEENLRWASNLLGVEYDKGAKDITRVFFTTTNDDLLFLDDEVFCIEEAVMKKNTNGTNLTNKTLQHVAEEPANITPQEVGEASAQSLEAFDLCVGLAGLKADAMDVWGVHNWHANLMAVLSVGVAKLMTKEQLRAVVAQRLPNYSQTEDCQKLIDYFYEKYDANKGFMNTALREINAKAQQKADNSCTANSLCNAEPPEMPKKLPKLVQLLTSRTPEMYKPAVAHAVFPPLATHLCDVRFTYTDQVEHEATLMNCLMAGTGAGKGCIDKPIERIMADIAHRDKENERREAEWKKDCQKRGANKDKLMRPEGLVIQIIDPDMTKPALVTRMDESEGHFVYVKLNELDLFEQLKGQTGKQHFQLMCLAFDPDSEYGQTRIGTQSVTARPKCRFNWNACTTILKGRRFFRNVLTDGPISRINFCTIPKEEIGAKQPVYGKYDAEFDETLKPYIDNLLAARGLIDCPQAFKLAQKLQDECAEMAQLNQNETYWNLSHRACVIAWLKACVIYVANGMKWERSIEEFIRWSLSYDLYCKMVFFGNKIEAANKDDDSRIGSRGPKNLLTFLPDEFTVEDARRVRTQQGLTGESENTRKMISQWKTRGFILQLTVDSFQKSDRYRRKSDE